MIAWKGLLKKEWQLIKFSIIINLIFLIVVPTIIYTASYYLGSRDFFTAMMVGLIFAHVFYLPALFFESLSKEGQTQLWLYNPNSVSKLILAKYIVCLGIFFFSLMMTILITYFASYQLNTGVPIFEMTTIAVSIVSIFNIVIIGSVLSLWILFLWTFYYSLANKPILKHLRWPFILVITLSAQIVSNIYESASFFKNFREFWVIKVEGFIYEINNSSWQFYIGPPEGGSIEISVITILIRLLIALLLFAISTWLLERKVEV